MKILHTVEFYHPSVGGAQEVVKQISERLVRRGHEVTVATTTVAARTGDTVNGVRIRAFPIAGNAVRGYSGPTEEYQAFLQDSRFDVMMNYAAQQWTADLAFPVLSRLAYPGIFATCGFSNLARPDYKGYFEAMPLTLRAYRQIVLHSSTYRDAAFARQHGIEHTTVIPNAAAEEEFGVTDATFRARYGIPAEVPLLVTVGSHTGLKGHRLVIEAFRRTRLDPAVLLVIGNLMGRSSGCYGDCRRRALRATALSFGRKRVLVLDPPRADVVAAMQAADLFVFGSNVECSPIVLFEAMAARTPFVTVGCGNAEEIIQWSSGGVLVPSRVDTSGMVRGEVADMARGIEELIRDPGRRQRLAQAGYRAWRQRFSWETVAGMYEELYQRASSSWRRDTA
jgi:L-malate glycosyltransferase